MINSRSHLVSATTPSSDCKSRHQEWCTFSRSYGTNLPSSFTRVLSSALVFSTRLPVSVCGTALQCLCLEAFLGSRASVTSVLKSTSPSHLRIDSPDLPKESPYMLRQPIPTDCSPSFLRHSIATLTSTGILTCCPSTTPFGLALGADSPCSD